jgi:integrase
MPAHVRRRWVILPRADQSATHLGAESACAIVLERVGLHALRHFYASALIRHGESVKVVQKRLGHSSAVVTLDTYAHLWPDSDYRTRDAVEAALSAPADSVRTESG